MNDVIIDEVPIGGHLVSASMTITELEYLNLKDEESWRDAVRRKLALHIVNEIIEKKLCEFTMIPQASHFTYLITARCYLAPHGNVKVVRTLVNQP